MATEEIVIDQDPRDPDKPWPLVPVVAHIEVPPKATSNGWGDMSWTGKR